MHVPWAEKTGFGPDLRPGQQGGSCPECDEPTILIGYDTTVVGTLCESCKRVIGIGVEFVDVHDAFDDPHTPGEPGSSDLGES